jgi:hypothetical protein
MHDTTTLTGTAQTVMKITKKTKVFNIGWCIRFAPSRILETIRKLELRHGMVALAGEAHRDNTNDDDKLQKNQSAQYF